MKSFKSVFFLIIVVLFLSGPAFTQPVEQTLARLFSYDPHPGNAYFSEKVPYAGHLADIEIKFFETWAEKKDSANISAIYFSFSAIKNGASLGSAQTQKFSVSTGMQKGQIIGETSLENLKFKATLDSFEKDSGGVTDLTVIFSMSYNIQELNKARESEANQSVSSSMNLCKKLAEKADALPDKNSNTKIALYQKALLTAPPETSSPDAAAFRKMVEQKITRLGGQAETTTIETKVLDISSIPQSAIEKPKAPVSFQSPAQPISISKKTVNREAVTLYNQAKSFFDQGKGPEGREALREALEIAPEYRDALVLLGENAFSNRKYARAKEAFDKALNLEDNDPETILKFFKACYYLGEGSSAVERIALIKNRYPEDRRVKLTLAEAYFQLGDLPQAKSLCEEVLAVDRGNYQATDLSKRIDRLMN